MTHQHMKPFLVALLQTAEVLNGTLSATKQSGYWLALQDLALDVFQAACVAVMREEAFFPAPVVFRTYARAYVRDQQALPPAQSARELLALREELLPLEDVRALIATAFKEWPS